MKQKFYFLCGNFEKNNFIYAVKFGKYPWHYFEELDSLSSAHGSLPQVLDCLITELNKLKTIEVPLDEAQAKNYYNDGKFTFNKKELKTYIQFNGSKMEDPGGELSTQKAKRTDQLLFIYGQTNPLLFLSEFEKCRDLKNEKDKMFKLRNFVDEPHKVEFSELYFTNDWSNMRQAFIKKYSPSFTVNKKRETSIDFNEETSLRSFVERKLKSLTTYTSLPFINQMEVVLISLPNEISNLFLIHEKLICSKTEIFEFCDSIQDLAITLVEEQPQIDEELQSNRMEIFNYDSELQSEAESVISDLSSIAGPAGGTVGGRGRERSSIIPPGELSNESTDVESSYSENSNQMLSSLSENVVSDEMSVDGSTQAIRGKRPKKIEGKVTKRGRGRPRKTLIALPEDSESSVLEYVKKK